MSDKTPYEPPSVERIDTDGEPISTAASVSQEPQ